VPARSSLTQRLGYSEVVEGAGPSAAEPFLAPTFRCLHKGLEVVAAIRWHLGEELLHLWDIHCAPQEAACLEEVTGKLTMPVQRRSVVGLIRAHDPLRN